MKEVFVDTNVLLYAVDDKDLDKRDRSRQWLAACWKHRCGRLSTQVLNEFYVNVRKKFSGNVRSEERRVGKECRSRWSPYH